MGCGTAILVGLRSLVVIFALAVVGLGAWEMHTSLDMDSNGNSMLDASDLAEIQKPVWQRFFNGVNRNEYRIWVSIATGSFTSIVMLYIFLTLKIDRLKATPYFLVPLEIFAMLAMGTAFAFSLISSLNLESLCIDLDASRSDELDKTYGVLCPLSKGHAIASGSGWLVLAITSLSAIIVTCRRSRQQKACSFEPTASSLGMSHGYQTEIPPETHASVPTLYDPLKPIPGTSTKMQLDDEVGLAISGADMARRDSGLTEASIDEKQISGPLGLENPHAVQQMRPARPWSEYPKRQSSGE